MVMPYLNFSGECEEAFRLYQRAFRGQEPMLVRYGDAPENPEQPLSVAQKELIMHGFVMLTETGGISGADTIWPITKGSAVNIHVNCESKAKADKAFSILSEDGEIVSPLEKNPPPHDNGVSGTVTDKYGFTWVLSATLD